MLPLNLIIQGILLISVHKGNTEADIEFDSFSLCLIKQEEVITAQIHICRFPFEEFVLLAKYADIDVARGQHLHTIEQE